MENEEYQDGQNVNEEILDDDYLLLLHRQLQEMKLRRKQAEQEATLLDNHVKCLKGEDQKYTKRIEVTRRETQKKEESLREQEEKKKAKRKFQKNERIRT